MSSKYYKTEGLILKKTPYGESDFLVRIFASGFGKIDLIAKGARKSVSKLNAHLDVFNFVRLSFVKNGDRLPTLTDAEIIERFDQWFLTGEAALFVHRVFRTLDILVQYNQEDDALLQQVLSFFQNTNPSDVHNKENEFLNALLTHEGYGSSVDLSALPSTLAEGIIKLWPALKN